MRRRRRGWLVVARPVGGVVGVAATGALWGFATNGFSLAVWKWWLLVGAVAATGIEATRQGLVVWRRRQGRVWVERPESDRVARPELERAVARLLIPAEAQTVGITTALTGAGGFGKTTLARRVCWDPAVRRAFSRRCG